MSEMKEIARIDELVSLLEKYNYEYYIENASSVSDAEYDNLMQELMELEARYPQYAKPNSPTSKVNGGVLSSFSKIASKIRTISSCSFTSNKAIFSCSKYDLGTLC